MKANTSRDRLVVVLAGSALLHLAAVAVLSRIVLTHERVPRQVYVMRQPVRILPVGAADGSDGQPDVPLGAAGSEQVPLAAPPLRASLAPTDWVPAVDPNLLDRLQTAAARGPAVIAVQGPTLTIAEALWSVGTGTGEANGLGTAGPAAGGGAATAGGAAGHGGRALPGYRRNPPPAYPVLAATNGWEGTAVLQVEVLATGAPGQVELLESSGYEVLDRAAIEGVRRWRFVPARENNAPVVAWVEVPISFVLAAGGAGAQTAQWRN